jgi:2-C-methyl-D-erythritol 4-phosphate cytidylyltransferase
MASFAVILPAAGKSQRFGDKNYKKPFAPLAGRAVWMHAAERFVNRPDVRQLILVVAAEDRAPFDEKFAANVAFLGLEIVEGGAERADSVQNALAAVSDQVEYVAVHDAARPCVADKWIDAVFAAASRTGAAILATPVLETLKRADGQRITETLDRRGLWLAQTPQVFARQVLVDAFARRASYPATDDAELVQRLGHPVEIVPGSLLNLKITTREDLKLAEHIVKALPRSQPSGYSHPFAGDDIWR